TRAACLSTCRLSYTTLFRPINGPAREDFPVVAASGAGQLLVAYQRRDPISYYDARVYVRALSFSYLGLGQGCAEHGDCQSAFCEIGRAHVSTPVTSGYRMPS